METTYTNHRYATKKALKDTVKIGTFPLVHCEGFGPNPVPDGTHVLVGPGPYERKWYATIEVKDGRIVKVKA
jgi:hypothetical protein